MKPVASGSRRLGRHVGVLALYWLLALLLTWPLLQVATTHVPGDGIDDPALVWNLWWIKVRLVDQLAPNIFDAGWMFHPIGVNLAFYTLTPLNGLMSIPLQSALNLVLANNLLLWLHLTLAAYGAFLLSTWFLDLVGYRDAAGKTSEWGDSTQAFWFAVTAGIIYSFASSKLFYASLGQFNIVSSHWIPFCVLYFLRTTWNARTHIDVHSALMAGLFFGFQSWAELTYASFLLIFAGAILIWALIFAFAEWRCAVMIRLVAVYALFGGMAALLLAPFLVAMVPELLREGDFFASGGGFADIFSADLIGYFVPTRLHPWLGEWSADLPFPNDKGQHIYAGFSAMFLALLGLIALFRSSAKRCWGWLWLLLLAFFWWLSLGPTLRIAGWDSAIPGPFALVNQLPFFSGNRYPSRYSVMVMLCLALLSAMGMSALWQTVPAKLRRLGPALLAVCMAGLFLLEHLSLPLPINDFRVPSVYTALAGDASGSTLLELPTGWRNGARVLGKSDVLIMMQQWYQTEHGLRRLGGNTSRNPAYTFQYFTDAPLIGDLIALMNADDERIAAQLQMEWNDIVERADEMSPAVLDFLDVDVVALYVEHAPELLLQFVEEVLPLDFVDEWTGRDWRNEDATIRIYRPQRLSTEESTIDLGSYAGNLYLAQGWSVLPVGGRVRYAIRRDAELLLDLPEAGGTLTFELFAPATAVMLSVNEHTLGPVSVAENHPQIVSVDLAPGIADQPVDSLRLQFGGQGAPASTLMSPPTAGWPIGATGILLAPDVHIFSRSAGEEVGDFAEIRINGTDWAINGRGYNLVALDAGGEVLDSVVFDTFANKDEADKMTNWLRSWPEQTVIVGAVADEASHNLSDGAVNALREIGVEVDLRGRFRWSHAFVGAVGSRPRTAVEAVELLRPALVTIGVPVNAEYVYGGIGRIDIVPLSH